MGKKCIVPLMIFAVLCAVVIVFLIFRCDSISCITTKHLSINRTVAIYERSPKTYRALFTTTFGFFRVEKQSSLSLSEAKTLTTATLLQMQGLFENARSPYPGPLSDEIVCNKKYKPTPTLYTMPSTDMTIYTGFANDRLRYGTCIDSQIAYKGYNALMYCKNHRSWYKIELFIPIGKLKDDTYYIQLLQNIQCTQ